MQPRVVRKVLDDDCLLDGEVHPAIAVRLQRVREIPMTGVANFLGVERDQGRAFLLWEFVEGRTLEEVLRDAPPARAAELRRELELLLETMHSLGLVHGAVHGRNVIVDPQGRVRLTHVTPLLYDDPKIDWEGVRSIFRVEAPHETEDLTLPRDDDGVAARSIIGAAALSVVGVAIAVLVVWYVSILS